MKLKDLQEAADKVITVNSNDDVAVKAVIKDIEPISQWCKAYLQQEEEMFAQEMEMIAEFLRQALKEDNNDS